MGVGQGNSLSDKWSDDQLVEFALALPSERETWDIVAKRGPKAEEQYWKKVVHFCFSKNPDDVVHVCTMLMNVGNVNQSMMALRQLMFAQHLDVKSIRLSSWKFSRTTENPVGRGPASMQLRDVPYVVKLLLIQELQKLVDVGDSRVEVNDVAGLEWTYSRFARGRESDQLLKSSTHGSIRHVRIFSSRFSRLSFAEATNQRVSSRNFQSERSSPCILQAFRLLHSWKRRCQESHLMTGQLTKRSPVT